jgi:6-phosphogluconolactonase
MGELMPTKSLRTPAKLFVAAVVALGLTSCSTNLHTVCNAANGGSCQCGPGVAACPINPGPEFLYGTSIGGQILAFSIDHNSGALTAISSVPGPSMSLSLTAVNDQFLYASDSLNAQLDGFSINQTTGALTALVGSPFSTGAISFPVGLASPPGSDLLYAADAGRVDAFSVSASGIPTAVLSSPFPSGSGLFLTVDPSGKFLYTAIDDPTGTGGVFAYTIDSAGALTAVAGSPFALPVQTGSNSEIFGIVDTGLYVYVALTSTNQIAAFSITNSTGALVPVPGSPFSAGATPTTLVFATKFLYALNSLDGTISGYGVDSNTGVLTPLSGSPFSIAGASMATDSFGEHLYVSGPAGIQAFSFDFNSGALIGVAGSPFPANGATAMTVVQIPPP